MVHNLNLIWKPGHFLLCTWGLHKNDGQLNNKITFFSEGKDLKYRHIQILIGQKEVGLPTSGFWMGSEIGRPDHLKSKQLTPFCQKPFDYRTKAFGFLMVCISNGSGSYSSGPYSYSPTLWKPNHLMFDLKNYGFWMFKLQILTVVLYKSCF